MISKTNMMTPLPVMRKVLLSLGSNLGCRKENLRTCISQLEDSKTVNILGVSSLYESSPMYNLYQSDFINCVVEVETCLKSLELLAYMQLIEKNIGRKENLDRNQARKIDIDILTYGNEAINQKGLIIPHPRIRERKFVLVPLFELKGNISMPGYVEKIEDLIKELDKNSDKIRLCKNKINEKNLSYSS